MAMPADPRVLYYASNVRDSIARVYVAHNADLGYKVAAAAVREIALHVESAHSTRDAVNMLARVEDALVRGLPADAVVVVDGVLGLQPPFIYGTISAEPAAAPPTVSSEGAALASRVRARLKRDAPAAFSAFRWVVIGVIIGLTWASLTG